MNYKAVIFDLDGTLLDTISDISDSVNETLKRYGYQTFSEQDYKHFVGRGVNELIHTVIREAKIDVSEFDRIKTGYIEAYARRNAAKTKPYPGIIELLKALKVRGIRLCILSNKPHFQTVDVVATYFSEIAWDAIYGKRPEFPIKPDPTSLMHMLTELNLKKSDVLYVGDTNTDMETARNGGLMSIGVLWGFRTLQELLEAGAGYIVNQPKDILNIIGGDDHDFIAG